MTLARETINEPGYDYHILIIEDDSLCQKLYKQALEKQGYTTSVAGSLSNALTIINSNQQKLDLILLDIHLPDNNSTEGIRLIKASKARCPIVILTGDSSLDQALRFFSEGAADFLLKTTPLEQLVGRISDFLSNDYVTKNFSTISEEHGIIFSSSQLRQILGKVERLKDVTAPILISGESGTGKERIAQFIHKTSSRSDGPFIAINCAAIPSNLFEAELFGYKKGAFTDAKKDKKGFFELCNNGTLFLDEIGELPLNLQAKLLRVLEQNEITPVGSCETIKVNTRIISASNKDLRPERSQDFFRSDLYYRLSVFQFNIPPLRERRSDILPLARSFAASCAKSYNKSLQAFSSDLTEFLLNYSWPGNVRELKNSIERGVALSEDGTIKLEDLTVKGASLKNNTKEEEISSQFLDQPYDLAELQFQKHYLDFHMERCEHNISEVARITEKNRMWVYRVSERIRKMELEQSAPPAQD